MTISQQYLNTLSRDFIHLRSWVNDMYISTVYIPSIKRFETAVLLYNQDLQMERTADKQQAKKNHDNLVAWAVAEALHQKHNNELYLDGDGELISETHLDKHNQSLY